MQTASFMIRTHDGHYGQRVTKITNEEYDKRVLQTDDEVEIQSKTG